ncbi:MAG: segregation/condensation protein A [Okeania sp. SIO2G4]|uniref:segregation/condensation protein A n=1 Tax=unclassified Okeania TaxID=2634635 RepID=UPI0013B727F5|nr:MULTISPECIES: ScpA family protein [unclassified Okeania]NEP05143.1 segregation/condensation protein A [Okeania sp. SIO4D6]NEP38062.1 segregation/condensation protein A [Okeania sp. SIO2H7]NEP70917.1 segregation/condensation protein A [Okeania sp. SIO2G5]NEP92303.1 segregation/condensation protein A [Okeania sp. SIO2F5]NEQ89969.1 segregation/condensation protein A [Okeania sp. SIO2G4]
MTVGVPQVSETVSEGIALLTNLAEKGEINPWDVQVIDVIDRYLSKLTPESNISASDDFTNLSQSGQAFLYASILVWLKADHLANSESSETNSEISEEVQIPEAETFETPKIPLKLEQQLRRRAVAPSQRKRRVTLQELIEQLQLIKSTIEDRKVRPRIRKNSSKAREQAARAIAELAHQENLVDTASDLEKFLLEKSSQSSEGCFEFDRLLELWSSVLQSKAENECTNVQVNYDRVGVFWALLLLSAQSKVELSQEEFYQDIRIRTISSTSEGRSVLEKNI